MTEEELIILMVSEQGFILVAVFFSYIFLVIASLFLLNIMSKDEASSDLQIQTTSFIPFSSLVALRSVSSGRLVVGEVLLQGEARPINLLRYCTIANDPIIMLKCCDPQESWYKLPALPGVAS